MKSFAIELPDETINAIKKRFDLETDGEVRSTLEAIILVRFNSKSEDGLINWMQESQDELGLMRKLGK